MPFKKNPQVFSAQIRSVTFGTGEKAVTIGGGSTFPLYTFDAPCKNKPAIGAEITDEGADLSVPGIAAYYEGCHSLADIAKKASVMPGASFLVLTLTGADPAGANKSVEECVNLTGEVLSAIDCPLAIQGCKNTQKDTALFEALAEAYQGKNLLFVSCREENYKALAASTVLAYGQKLSAESAVDINLAKQLNVLISQIGVQPASHVMNIGSAAAGYGYEYVASTFDRVRSAALMQSDAALQMPIITPVSDEAWAVKEALVSEEDIPEWGCREDRGVRMEITTAAAAITGGADAVILRHPRTVAAIARFVDELA